MSEQFLVSVIVPIYKVEAYIDKCIRSILKQTYKNYEVILLMMVHQINAQIFVINMRVNMIIFEYYIKKMEDYQMQEMQVFQLLEVSM